jgi:hypothetical protein
MKILNKLSECKKWIIRIFSGSTSKGCKHLHTKETWRDYPDAYIEFECLDCGEKIYEDMYNS